MQQHEAVLDIQLKELKLSTFKNNWHDVEQLAITESYSYSQYLSHLCSMEIDKRIGTRLTRMIKCLVWGGCPNNFISFSPKHIRRFIKNLRFNSIPFYDSVKWCFHF